MTYLREHANPFENLLSNSTTTNILSRLFPPRNLFGPLTMAPTNQKATSLKQPTARASRYLKSVEPQLKERGKNVLLLKGIRCSDAMGKLLKELRAMQAPNVKLLSKKNQIVPFEHDGQQSLEFLTTKNDCALFALASHNKKRPNNLVMGRTFDRHMLDMCEFSVFRFKSMNDYSGSIPKKRVGSKPLLLFCGDAWLQSLEYRNVQNLLTDFYRGDVIDKFVLSGVDHLIVFTVATPPGRGEPIIHQRTYFCKLKKNPTDPSSPLPYLLPCGPDMDMSIRRTQWAEPDLYKAARQQPAGIAKKKKKNQSTNLFGETVGRLHLAKQNLDERGGRKVKALRRAERMSAQEEKAAIEKELDQEKQEMDYEVKQTFGLS